MKEKRPLPGERYQHESKLYQVITIALHSETKEELVICQAMYEDFTVYAMPLKHFINEMNFVASPAAQQEYYVEKEKTTDFKQEEDRSVCETPKSSVSIDKKQTMLPAFSIPDRMTILTEFLDRKSYGEKLEYLHEIKKYLDDKTINDISFSLDLVIEEGELEDKIRSLEKCLKTFQKFENSRLR